MRQYICSSILCCIIFISANWCGRVEADYSVILASQWKTSAGGNDHWYSLVEFDAGGISWDQAKTLADAATLNGQGGHLATFTSYGEWLFVRDNLLEPNRREFDQAWLGATDRASEGNWQWVTGEAFNFSVPAIFDDLNDEDFLVAWRFGVNDPLQWNDINDTRNRSNRAVFEFGASTAVPEPSTFLLSLFGIGSTYLVGKWRGKKQKSLSQQFT